MKFKHQVILWVFTALSFIVSSCSDVVPVATMRYKIPDMTLYYSKPIEFNFTITGEKDKAGLYYLEMDVTYYTPIGRNDLPLEIIVENTESTEKFPEEFHPVIPLKVDEKWQGKQEEYETDYTLTYIAIPAMKLKPGNYKMKIFANDPKNEKIYGVVRINARIFENESPKKVS